MMLNQETFKKTAMILSKAKQHRLVSRMAVRDQQPPEGEAFVFGYLPKKKGKPTKGYEGWLITEMPEANSGGWRQVRVRMDVAGTCRFDLTWNGERFAGSKALTALQDRFPKMAETAQRMMEGHEAMRHIPR